MKARDYHMGLLPNWKVNANRGNNPLYGTLTIQMRLNVDCLSCELWRYMGIRHTTKQHIKDNKLDLLNFINQTMHSNFNKIIID